MSGADNVKRENNLEWNKDHLFKKWDDHKGSLDDGDKAHATEFKKYLKEFGFKETIKAIDKAGGDDQFTDNEREDIKKAFEKDKKANKDPITGATDLGGDRTHINPSQKAGTFKDDTDTFFDNISGKGKLDYNDRMYASELAHKLLTKADSIEDDNKRGASVLRELAAALALWIGKEEIGLPDPDGGSIMDYGASKGSVERWFKQELARVMEPEEKKEADD